MSALYDLYGVTNHFGSLNGGHYTATCLNSEDNQWYNFNDSSVSRTEASQINPSAAYLLFYRRRKSDDATPKVVLTAEEEKES